MANNGVNKVILIGNVGQTPKMRNIGKNRNVVNFSIATSESWKDGKTGKMKEHIEWHNVVAYSPLSDSIAKYVNKGTKLFVDGKLSTKRWTERSGNQRNKTEIIAFEFQILNNPDETVSDEKSQENSEINHIEDDDCPF